MRKQPIPTDRLAELLGSERGLTAAEVAARRERYGRNDILEAQSGALGTLLRETARDPMLWFLLLTGGLFASLGDRTEAIVLLVATVPLLGMDAYLHRRTQASTQGLASRLAARAKVLRDGVVADMAAGELVPGDLVVVGPGEAFPADGLIVAGSELQADESMLTGESFPAPKRVLGPAEARAPAAVECHWAFAGTRLLTGHARVRIAHVGAETLYGQVVRSARAGSHARTPLQIAVSSLVGTMVVAATAICLALAAIRLRQGHGVIDALVSAATLAVAALPEEFPVVFGFFLGVGVYRLARRKALVRRAVAVENIGRVTCICSDKTGTLTEGRLSLAHREPAPGVTSERLLQLAALAVSDDISDPLDAALTEAAGRSEPVERLAVFPFTEDRRRATVVARAGPGSCLAALKGAPEVVLGRCALDADEQERWREQVGKYAATGHKVIACASLSFAEESWPGGEPDRGFVFAGLLAFEDPVREGVRDAVQACLQAGIRVIMVTGDHPATALAIAREVGIADADVIARAVPAQKLELVRGLQSEGAIVAVTGDGVNDVPALQAADVGIAMGERGTRSAREVAAVVLLDDNFRTIVRAIAEGRQLFRNLQLSFAYLLMVHIPLVLSAAAIPLAGYPLLFLPIHIVWLELIIHPTALLVFQELPASDLLTRAAAPELGARLFDRRAKLAIGVAGTILAAALWAGYGYALGAGRDVEHARALSLAILVAGSSAITAVLSNLRTWTSRAVALAAMASLVAFVQLPALSPIVHLGPLHSDDWLLVAASTAVTALAAALAARSLHGATGPQSAPALRTYASGG
jgi:Ca2+-transporting ATPase